MDGHSYRTAAGGLRTRYHTVCFHIRNAGRSGKSRVSVFEAGTVVGESLTASNVSHAFLYGGGKMVDLGTLGGDGSLANGIDSAGQIIAFGCPEGEVWAHAYVLGPAVPEPGTLTLAALAGVLLLRRLW